MNKKEEKQYREWVRDFDPEIKKECRIRYLKGEINKLGRIVKDEQEVTDKLIKDKTSKWMIDAVKNTKDMLVVVGSEALVYPGGRTLYKGIGGYSIQDKPRQGALMNCGMNRHEKIKKLKRMCYELNSLENNKSTSSDISELIQEAKKVPIENFIKVNKGKALCPAHDDHDPSMKVYDTNTVHCFTCGFSDSVIGVVMKIHNLGFREALKFILNK